MFFRKGKRELFFGAAQERERGQETDFPGADLLQCGRIAHDLLKVAIEVQVNNEFFVGAGLSDAEQFGGFARADGSGQQDARNTKGTVERFANGIRGTQRTIGTPPGCCAGTSGSKR